MRYHAPNTVEEALAILADDEDARCLAGGATLVAMLNADLLAPSAVVSLRKISDLDGVRATADGFIIGAMTRHNVVANDMRLRGKLEVVRRAASVIGHPAIRAVGTIGGSIAHADPSADYPTALVAVNAEIEITHRTGSRKVAADDFFVDFFTTALAPGEMVTAIHLSASATPGVSAYQKITRSDGDFAITSLGFSGSFAGDVCTHARIAVGGCGSTPVHVQAVDDMLIGTQTGDPRITEAAGKLAAACDPIDDVRGSAAYRRLLVARLLPNILELAKHSAER